jgi:hypothetical protein
MPFYHDASLNEGSMAVSSFLTAGDLLKFVVRDREENEVVFYLSIEQLVSLKYHIDTIVSKHLESVYD